MWLQKSTSKLNKLTYEYQLTIRFSRAVKKIVESVISTKQL